MTKWFDVAKKYIGTAEIKGPRHNSIILRWWSAICAPFADDESAWCAAFVGGVLEECGIQSSRSAGARSYMKWGKPLTIPAVGCIVVFWRGSPDGWAGHVGFVAGRDKKGNLMVIGGNQGDKVSLAAFDVKRVLGYRWPKDMVRPFVEPLPIIEHEGALSNNEA